MGQLFDNHDGHWMDCVNTPCGVVFSISITYGLMLKTSKDKM